MKEWGKHIILLIVASTISFLSFGESDFTDGAEAYEKENFTLAAEKFEAVIKNNSNDVAGYYNLGLAKKADKKYGEAVWAFEKVLKLSPNDSETKDKIQTCYTELNLSEEWSPRLNSVQSGLYNLSPDKWSYLAIGFSVLVCLCIILFKLMKSLSLKRLLLVVGFLSACFLISSVLLANLVKKYQNDTSYALVTKKTIPTFIDKGKTAKTNLNEATRLQLVQEDSSLFVLVKSDFGEEHLVKREDLSFI